MACCGSRLTPGVIGQSGGACDPPTTAPTGYLAPDGVTVLVGSYRITYARVHGRCVGTGAVLNEAGEVLLPTPRMVPLPG